MDILTFVGLALGFAAVYYVMHVGQIVHLLYNFPALVLVLGGTIASTLVTYPWSVLKRAPKAILLMIFPPKIFSPQGYTAMLVGLAEKSKREGVDSLIEELPKIKDQFLVEGLRMVLDGLDPEIVRENLNKEIIFLRKRHAQVSAIFRSMGTYSPIFGLLGTLIGVVQVLQNLTSPEAIGASMAVAVTTTFYGIFGANFLFLPTAGKLDALTEQEVFIKEVAIEGILSIQKGDIPLVVSRKLQSYMAQKMRQLKGPKKLPVGRF